MKNINEILHNLAIKGDSQNRGICLILSMAKYGVYLNGKYHSQFLKHCKCWPYYSGNISYPVPAGSHDLSRQAAYKAYNKESNSKLGMWTGEYGLLRRDLALHLSKCEWVKPE